MRYNTGAKNVPDSMVYSLGHSGSAMESTTLIDIPGVFLSKDGKAGMRAVLKDCSVSVT